MIEPNMATMLGFIFINIKIDLKIDKKFLKNILDDTFNSITVDGEMSTSDMVLLVSNISQKNSFDNYRKKFLENLRFLMTDLAQQIIKDGEGCTKFITVTVKNARSKKDAIEVSKTVANSLLFKTAMFGCDSNWGRIIMAIGKCNARVEPDKISLAFGNNKIITNGKVSKINENKIYDYLFRREIEINIDLSLGKECHKVWTSDITNDYIKINADYRS